MIALSSLPNNNNNNNKLMLRSYWKYFHTASKLIIFIFSQKLTDLGVLTNVLNQSSF